VAVVVLATVPLPLLLSLPLARIPQSAEESAAREKALFSALALAPTELEERLALALSLVVSGDCETALEWLDTASGAAGDQELVRRVVTERARLAAWIELRDAFLAELEESGKPLALELDGKRVSTPIRREGDELVLARGPTKRLSVRALAPEMLVAAIPKERFAGAMEWLKIYPYCVAANPKWKRLTTSEPSSAELERDAQEHYPRLRALGEVTGALTRLAQRAPPADAAEARAALAEVQGLLAHGGELACVRVRRPALGALALQLLEEVAAAMEVAELVHASVGPPAGPAEPGALRLLRLVYDFSTEDQARDWVREDEYLEGLRAQLDPVGASVEAEAFGPMGFGGRGEFCWRHVLEFQRPLRVRYRVRWEPFQGQPQRTFAFALGLLGDADGRHVRVNELGFLYVDEKDGPYTAVRPKGDATVELGRTYAIELVHDGREVAVSVEGVPRARAAAKARTEGRIFLWGHSDVLVRVPELEIEGCVTPASLAALRAAWVRARLDALGLEPRR
jgi:hypothetical protein